MSDQIASTLEIRLGAARERCDLATEWQELQYRSDHSFFQSWGWIGTWLEELPASFDPLCITAWYRHELVGLGILTPATIRRHAFVKARQLHLHATGVPRHDQLTIEYNGIIADRRIAATVVRSCLDHLRVAYGQWDELCIPGVSGDWLALAVSAGGLVVSEKCSPCHYVDMRRLADRQYLSTLSRQTRHQIRRSLRLYGVPRLQFAGDLDEAASIWTDLKALHQTYWQGRGQPGAFANPSFEGFHDRLIHKRFKSGEIQLVRVGDTNKTISCLYNFVYHGRVYAYQSGIEVVADNRLKPGLIAHHAAVEFNRQLGHDRYDFLAGDARYKRSLSNGKEDLYWIVVQRTKPSLFIERKLRELRRLVRSARSPK